MLTKVSEPNHLTTPNIVKWYKRNKLSNDVERIQDNLKGCLLIKLKSDKIILFNYYLNRYYSHNLIQVHWNENIILKQIDSFDQNNWLVGTSLRNYVLQKIKYINKYEFEIKNVLGIGGEYYLYWGQMNWTKKLIGISNHESIIADANLNIPWSYNFLVNYNDLNTYPQILYSIDLILINLAQINRNTINYIEGIEFKKIILIICNLPDSKLKLLKEIFNIKKIKYFKNYTNLIRIIEINKKIK